MSSPESSTTMVVVEPVPSLPTAAYVINGLATLALGIMILVWPKATLAVVAVLFGIQLLFLGISTLAGAFGSQRHPALRILLGLLGAYLIVAGVICILHPFTSLKVLVLLTAIGWIASAIGDFAIGARREGSARWGSWLLGLVGLGGAIVLLVWPKLSLLTLVTFAGVVLIAWGVFMLIAAWARSRATA